MIFVFVCYSNFKGVEARQSFTFVRYTPVIDSGIHIVSGYSSHRTRCPPFLRIRELISLGRRQKTFKFREPPFSGKCYDHKQRSPVVKGVFMVQNVWLYLFVLRSPVWKRRCKTKIVLAQVSVVYSHRSFLWLPVWEWWTGGWGVGVRLGIGKDPIPTIRRLLSLILSESCFHIPPHLFCLASFSYNPVRIFRHPYSLNFSFANSVRTFLRSYLFKFIFPNPIRTFRRRCSFDFIFPNPVRKFRRVYSFKSILLQSYSSIPPILFIQLHFP